jgi:hypothetical protein
VAGSDRKYGEKMNGQTRGMSWLEAIGNTMIGYLVALVSQLIVFPALGIAVTLSQNLLIGVIFMTISLVRSYLLRRLFNWIDAQKGRSQPTTG